MVLICVLGSLGVTWNAESSNHDQKYRPHFTISSLLSQESDGLVRIRYGSSFMTPSMKCLNSSLELIFIISLSCCFYVMKQDAFARFSLRTMFHF